VFPVEASLGDESSGEVHNQGLPRRNLWGGGTFSGEGSLRRAKLPGGGGKGRGKDRAFLEGRGGGARESCGENLAKFEEGSRPLGKKGKKGGVFSGEAQTGRKKKKGKNELGIVPAWYLDTGKRPKKNQEKEFRGGPIQKEDTSRGVCLAPVLGWKRKLTSSVGGFCF